MRRREVPSRIFSCCLGAEMRKIVIALSLLMLSLPVFASPSFGYSLAPVGAATPTGHYGGLTISAIFSPAKELHTGDISVSVDLSPVSPFFEGVTMSVSSPLFILLNHPFPWIFSNQVLWAPTMMAGAQYRLGNEWSIVFGLSPFTFQDTHFVYEFLSPYALYSFTSEKWGWGMYVMRFSYFF